MKKIIISFFITAVVAFMTAIVSIAAGNNIYSIQTDDLTKYAEKMTGVSLKDISSGEKGKIIYSSPKDYAEICIDFPENKEKILINRIEGFFENSSNEKLIIPETKDNNFVENLKNQDIIKYYNVFFNGHKSKETRKIKIIISKDENKIHLYIIG